MVTFSFAMLLTLGGCSLILKAPEKIEDAQLMTGDIESLTSLLQEEVYMYTGNEVVLETTGTQLSGTQEMPIETSTGTEITTWSIENSGSILSGSEENMHGVAEITGEAIDISSGESNMLTGVETQTQSWVTE